MMQKKKTAPRKPRKEATPKKPNGAAVEAPKMHPINEDELGALMEYIGASTSPKPNGEILALVGLVQQVAQRPMPGAKK